ncbi:2-oxo-4-hydroxy-4-carboxy-5-ureidoimidazoline decarboxylase-like [Cotesia glomerata]|uniref:2-oxo-4-hydroxy-4-carboxy-5-ureidoimidazoline decarboxylase n=1 Tax=Cotesia glomerata TaxID=32391 RepID=A0AAV7IU02_COTGL|nr:2-oxo-4-hydroxy-4-carboxy-5-ureidoimidazoline decarboxylase-like [Cotesia glomerata]KAH0557781.1 hypothetical protein KQX54_011684 [Cotesia glomerata]
MGETKLTIEEINSMSKIEFCKIFGNIVEHSSEATEAIEELRPFEHVSQLENLFCNFIEYLDDSEKEIILKNHPELTGEIYNEKILTTESQNEQKIAGINQMTTEEKIVFNNFNKLYKNKYSYPFVICVRENSIASIISSVESRLKNPRNVELGIAIEEVKKISKLRLKDLVDYS